MTGTYSTNLPVRAGFDPGPFIPNEVENEMEYPTSPPVSSAIPPRIDASPFGTENPPSAFRNFEGITATGWRPPDPEVAAGPYNIVAVTNSHFAIFSKDGVNGYQSSFAGFMGSDYFLFDPKVAYDNFANRFVILMLALKKDGSNNVTESHYVLLYSDDSNAYGSWSWRFLNAKYDGGTFDNNHWVDFPHLGIAQDGICVSGIKFGTYGTGTSYSHTRFLRSAEVYGSGGTYWWDYTNFQSDGSSDYRPVPARQLTNPGAFYNVAGKEWGSNKVCVRRFTNYTFGGSGSPTAPTMTETLVTVGTYTPNGLAYQQGNANKLEVNDGRIMHVSYANGKLWCVNGSSFNYGDGYGARSTIRTYCMDIYSSYNLLVNDTVGNSGLDYYYPAVACNPSGDAVVSFGRSGSSEYSGCRYIGYKSGDTGFGYSVGVKSGVSGYYSPVDGRNRWGDYFGASFDPWDQKSFWMIGQWAVGSTTWGTWIQEANFKPNKLVVTASPSAEITSTATLSATITRSDTGAVLSGETVYFYVDSSYVGSGVTNGSGVATFAYAVPFAVPTTHSVRADTPATTTFNDGSSTGTLTATRASTSTTAYNTYPTAGTTTTLWSRTKRTTDNVYVDQGTVWFYVNGSYVGSGTCDANGWASLNWAVPSNWQGDYTFGAYYVSNTYYWSSSDFAAHLYAYQPTNLYAWSATGRYTETVNLWTRHYKNDGSALVGSTVYYYLDADYLGTATTDGSGYAYFSYTIPTSLSVGNHTIAAYAYAASGYWEYGYGTNTLTVRPRSFLGAVGYNDLASWDAGTSYPIRIRVKNTAGTVLSTTWVNSDYNNWELPFSGATGNYILSIKPSHWLSEVTSPVYFNASTYGAGYVVTYHRNGDCTGDDIVDIADYTFLAAKFDSVLGDGTYSVNADLNGDTIVDIADYTILATQFDQVGVDYP